MVGIEYVEQQLNLLFAVHTESMLDDNQRSFLKVSKKYTNNHPTLQCVPDSFLFAQ